MNKASIRHQDDEDVQQIAEDASKAACAVLDRMFPGSDNGGISSTFAAQLETVLLRMLAGQSVVGSYQTSPNDLSQHILTDASFGNPLARGDQFLVVRRTGCDPMSREYEALNDSGTRFVQLGDVENIDPFTSYDAAVKTLLTYLRGPNAQGRPEDYKVAPVGFGVGAYSLDPRYAYFPPPAVRCLSPDCLS